MSRPFGAIALIATALAAATSAAAQLPRMDAPPERQSDELQWSSYRVFDARDGLPQSAVYALVQDAEGLVYAGTEDGVARFDGQRWEALALPPSAAAPNVVDLHIDAADGLWAADDVFGLLYRAAGSRAMRSVEIRGANLMRVNDLASAGANRVWVATSAGLFNCRADGCAEVAALSGRDVAEVLPAAGPQGPCLWVALEGEGLFRLDAPETARPQLSARLLSREDGLHNNAIRSMAWWNDALWIGTGRGLARWSGSSLVVYGRASGFVDGIVYALDPGVDREGRPVLRAAQRPGGLIEIAPDLSWRRVGAHSGLPEDSAFSLLHARSANPGESTLWIGTVYSGVARFEPGSWQAMDERAGLPHRAIMGMGRVSLLDGRERYWVGTVRGSVIWEQGRWREWLPDSLEDEIVFELARSRDAVWLAASSGLHALRSNGAQHFDTANSALPGINVLGLHLQQRGDGGERIWLATRHGAAHVEAGVVRLEPELSRLLGDDFFRDFFETADARGARTLWALGQGGLAYDRGEGWRALPAACLVHRDVMDAVEHRGADGRIALWAGTRGGVTRIDLDSLECRSLGAEALGKPTIYQLQFDRRGRLYLFGYDGVRRLEFAHDAPDDLRRARIEHFGLADGLPSLEFNRGASLVDQDGRLWGGSSGGVAIYDPEVEGGPGAPAPLRLLEASVLPDQRVLVPGSTLAAGDEGLRFRFALLTARREHRISYRTELRGLDRAPGEWSDRASIDYARLPPGDYEFRVWGRDEHGVVSAAPGVAFRVDHPPWRQPVALALYAALLVGAGVMLGRLRARALAQRALRLEQLVGARTAELADANQRLEQASLTDPLTGLGNRRRFYAFVEGRSVGSAALGLLLMDIDYFKRVNDGLGHDAGDAVLREFAQRLSLLAGADGLAVRWGGEEFLLALAGATPETARAVARTVLDAIRTHPFAWDSHHIAATCSIGWVCLPWRGEKQADLGIDQALTLADLALYRAKRGGRNRAAGVVPGDHEDALIEAIGRRVSWLDDTATSPAIEH